MHVLQDLDGVTIARATADKDKITLILTAPSGFSPENNVYYPAESLRLDGVEAIATLHQLAENLLAAYAEANQEPRP